MHNRRAPAQLDDPTNTDPDPEPFRVASFLPIYRDRDRPTLQRDPDPQPSPT
jgi:hypothetical protein